MTCIAAMTPLDALDRAARDMLERALPAQRPAQLSRCDWPDFQMVREQAGGLVRCDVWRRYPFGFGVVP